jgi:ATP-binding cassette subfamily F protein uup
MSEEYNAEQIRQVIALTGLGRLAGKEISNGSVSGGERQRIALARALYCGRDWIFMDEPTNNLDADTVEWLKDFICSTDRTLVFVTHDRGLAGEAEAVIELSSYSDCS